MEDPNPLGSAMIRRRTNYAEVREHYLMAVTHLNELQRKLDKLSADYGHAFEVRDFDQCDHILVLLNETVAGIGVQQDRVRVLYTQIHV